LVAAEVCVRGLLCLPCNTALGLIERKHELARAYLDSPSAQLVVVDAA
jgi:Recombination endonuclease VII